MGGLINAFLILIALLLLAEKPGLLPKKLVSMWAPFLLVALIGVAIAPVKSDAIRAYLAQISYFAMFVGAFYLVRSTGDFKRCVRPVLGDDVELGANAQLPGGIRIGHGCKICAMSVVLTDVPDGATAVGAPARIILSTSETGSQAPYLHRV